MLKCSNTIDRTWFISSLKAVHTLMDVSKNDVTIGKFAGKENLPIEYF